MGNCLNFQKDSGKQSPLITSVCEGDYDKTNKLIDRGENVNEEDSANNTVLMYAVGTGNYELVILLLQRGVTVQNVLQENLHGLTALSLAQKNGDDDMVAILKQFLEKHSISLEQKLRVLTDELKANLNVCFDSHFKSAKNILLDSEVTFSFEDTTLIQPIDQYIDLHRSYANKNPKLNIQSLIKGAPVYGDKFKFYTSTRYALLNKGMLDKLLVGESVLYPWVIRCTWNLYKLKMTIPVSAPSAIVLVFTVVNDFLFGDDEIVFVGPRYIRVDNIVQHAHCTIIYVS